MSLKVNVTRNDADTGNLYELELLDADAEMLATQGGTAEQSIANMVSGCIEGVMLARARMLVTKAAQLNLKLPAGDVATQVQWGLDQGHIQ